MYHVLYNPKSGNGTGLERAEKVRQYLEGKEIEFADVTSIKDMKAYLANLSDGDAAVLCGGDGTLSRFVSDTYEAVPENIDVLFFGTGSGNDFLRDIGKEPESEPIDIRPYAKNLPTVTVNGETRVFINGIGYGIDGYCCEVADKMRDGGKKNINYTSIAIKGLLFHYKPTEAVVTVDGVENTYHRVWLAPTMNGRFFGGGMMPTPSQNRLRNDTVSTLVMGGKGRIKTLIAFPSIFKGEHIKHTEMGGVLTGREVTVKFDRPVALQIDGETVLNVREYTVRVSEAYSHSKEESKAEEKEMAAV